MIYVLIGIIVLFFLGFVFAPFPHWPSYFLLWKNVLFNRSSAIPLLPRLKQGFILLRYLIFCPLYTFLWYLDEILYPAYKKLEIKPIFIIGTPRSGTTFLHRTLVADKKNFFGIRHIEWRLPYIFLQKLIIYFKLDKKLEKMNYWPKTEAGIKAAKMHAESLFDFEEDAILFEERFLHHLFLVLRFPYKDILTYMDNFELLSKKTQKHIMKIHQRVIQKIMYLHGINKIYLSKEVASHSKLNWLINLYPQAKFIINVRNSYEFVNSIAELIKLSTLAKSGVDVTLIDGLKLVWINRMRVDCLILLEFLQRDIKQIRICIPYNQLIKDVKNTVTSLYEQLNLPLSAEYEKYLDDVQLKEEERKIDYSYEKKVYSGFEDFDNLVSRVQQMWF